jgi:hypothetical protein
MPIPDPRLEAATTAVGSAKWLAANQNRIIDA